MKPRALFLTHHAPWPTTSGGRLRDAQLVPRMLQHARIELVAVTRNHEMDRLALAQVDLPGLTTHLFRDESLPALIPRRASNAAWHFLQRLSAQLQFDVVHVEGHYLLHLLPKYLRRRTLLAEHNIESTLLDQRAALDCRMAAWRGRQQLLQQEEHAWRASGGVVALTAEDAVTINRRAAEVPVHMVPNGWDHIDARTSWDSQVSSEIGVLSEPRLLFVANYAYPPNDDAAHWLLDMIFPIILAHIPQARLVLVGANASSRLQHRVKRCPGVELTGWVSSVVDELDRADIVLCPLRIGGGIKVKTVEALRRGCVLVSTSIGTQGLSPALRSAIAIADDADGFAASVVRLCHEPRERVALRRRLLLVQVRTPTWDAAAAQLGQLWSEVAQRAAEQTVR